MSLQLAYASKSQALISSLDHSLQISCMYITMPFHVTHEFSVNYIYWFIVTSKYAKKKVIEG